MRFLQGLGPNDPPRWSGIFWIHKICLYPVPDHISFTNHRSWDKSQMHPTHPGGPPAFWKTPESYWKICAQFGGQLWHALGMIYMALVGLHRIRATLANSSFRVSDSFEITRIRSGQMGSPTGIRWVSSNSCGKPGHRISHLSTQNVQNTCYTDGVSGWRTWINKCFPGFNKNKLLLISDGRKAGLILLAFL